MRAAWPLLSPTVARPWCSYHWTVGMHLNAAAGCGPDWPGYEDMALLIRTILPRITTLGVATEDDVGIDTLAGRLRAESGDSGTAVTRGLTTAWAQHQARP